MTQNPFEHRSTPRLPDRFPELYEQLRGIAASLFRQERVDHTLSPTALVNEAVLRLMAGNAGAAEPQRMIAATVREMRRVLVDHARGRRAAKRGGLLRRLALEDAAIEESEGVDALVLDEALARLSSLNERQARVAELRLFGGLGVDATAAALGVCARTVKGDWRVAQAWLRREISERDAV